MKNNNETKTEAAIKRIKELECPTGELEGRIARILERYDVASSREVEIEISSSLDMDDGQLYKVQLPGDAQTIMVEAKTGMDDYVTIVTDAYMDGVITE